jgi:hypothetical protein
VGFVKYSWDTVEARSRAGASGVAALGENVMGEIHRSKEVANRNVEATGLVRLSVCG